MDEPHRRRRIAFGKEPDSIVAKLGNFAEMTADELGAIAALAFDEGRVGGKDPALIVHRRSQHAAMCE